MLAMDKNDSSERNDEISTEEQLLRDKSDVGPDFDSPGTPMTAELGNGEILDTGVCSDLTPPHSLLNQDQSKRLSRAEKRWDCSDEAFKRRIMKNVYVVGCVFALLFTAIAALVNLQSSLFIDQGLGVVCQSINYVALALSSLVLPKLLISKLGHKWTLVVALQGCIIWMAANGYATWVTMTIASVIVGACSAPMWTAFGAFLTILAGQYASRTGRDKAQTVSLFFGIGIGLLKTSRLFGSLLAWGVLQSNMRNTSVVSAEVLDFCGSRDCPWLHTGNVYYEVPPNYLLWTLVGICIAIGIAAILLAVVFMDELPVTWYQATGSHKKSPAQETLSSVLAASKLHANIKQLLVIPVSLYMGLSVSFTQADYNKSYVTCALGIWMVGLVLIPSAVFSVISAFLSGRLGRGFVQFIFGFLLDASLLITCLLWPPRPDAMAVLFVMSGLFGITSALWHTQVNVLVGVLFRDKESAMANCMLWQSVGFSVSFGMSRSVCVDVKIYTTLSTLVVAMICLVVLQILRKREHIGTGSDYHETNTTAGNKDVSEKVDL